MKNIYLIGLMGAGKSSVALELGRRLGRRVLDTDGEIVRLAGMAIPDIFHQCGEAEFREREAAVLVAAAAQEGLVVATGGGIVLRATNREKMRASGIVIYLAASADELWRRLSASGLGQRPLLYGPNPLGKIRSLLREREPLYREIADYTVVAAAFKDAGAVAQQIEVLIGEG